MADSDNDCVLVENLNYKSISCEKIPEIFLDKLIARKHFSRYGRINKFILFPNRLSCTVDYELEEEAKNALLNAGIYNGQQFPIKYTETENSQVRNTEEWVDPDVQAELDAMGNVAQRNFSRTPQQIPQPLMSINVKLVGQQQKVPKPILKSKPVATTDPNTGSNSILQQQKIDINVKNELESILRKPAVTAEDQYKILDTRDKLIRLTTIRTTDIKKVVSTKGTCPDMCPEKERLLRETRNQIAVFELDQNDRSIMDYKLAIKEYSRSSADQETPLAHELRSEEVLKMTMNYLMHRIMALCDDPDINIGDWFHFVWDRTRSIRKDITQQELCSLGGVQLLEQCARFHIHCAARLIGEDPSVFDQRINTENLTKCLQTLKYMYHDLRLKNVKCPKEAEFRGYIILLNLQDSNFLWEVKQLPEEMQKSNEIQMAVAFYLAMENNNYVKFFNLIRKTTYMNGCILLRYFSQIRYIALQRIVKAYNKPRVSVSLTLKYLRGILAFESEEETISFLNHYGLECDTEKVRLDSLYKPEEQFLMDRSLEIIESKRNVSVGEAICGQALESLATFENHEPHCSFDEYGYLMPEAWTAEDQLLQKQGQAQKQRTPTRNYDNNIFKMPVSSPPISPKQQLMKSSVFGGSTIFGGQSQLKPIKTGNSSFQQTENSAFLKPINQQSVDTFDSIFRKPKDQRLFDIGEMPTDPSQPTKSIFGNAVFGNAESGNQEDNIFNTNFNSSQSSNQSENIFKTNVFATQKTDNIFQFFNKTPTLTLPTPSTTISFGMSPQSIFGQLSATEDINNQNNVLANFQNSSREKEEAEEKEALKRQQEEEQILLEEAKKKAEYESLMKEEKRKSEQLLAEKRENIHKISLEIYTEIYDEIVYENFIQIAKSELQKYSKILINSELITENLLNNTISEIILKISTEEFIIHQRNHEILIKYFTLWKFGAIKKRQRRKLIQETPIWIGGESLDKTALQVAHSAQNQNLKLMKRYRLGIPKNFQLLLPPEAKKINIFSLLSKELQNFDCKKIHSGLLQIRKYFKFLISLPQEYEEIPGFNSYYSKFLDNSIEREQTIDTTKGFLCESHNNLSICLRKISGIMPRNEVNQKVSTECNHANGLLFIMTTANDFNTQYKRLHHLLKLSEINKRIPVALICYQSQHEDDCYGDTIEYSLEIDELIDDEKISCLELIKTDENHLSESLELGLRFVGRNADTDNNLEMQNFVTFLQFNLADGIWQRFNSSWQRNTSFRQFCLKPQNIINLYNESINRLIDLAEEDFDDYPEFPSELKEFIPKSILDIQQDLEYFPNDWKNYDKRNKKIANFLKKLKLKNIVNGEFPNEIEALEKEILNYCNLNMPNCEKSYRLAGYSAIKILLEQLNKPDLLHLSIADRLKHLSWLYIIRPIALENLTYLWKIDEENLPNEIIYRKKYLDEFNNTAWWLQDEKVREIKYQSENEYQTAGAASLNACEDELNETDANDDCIDLEPILNRGLQLIKKADRNINKFKYYTETSREVTKNLDLSLYEYDYKNKLKKFHPREDDLRTTYSIKPPSIKKSKISNQFEENCSDDYDDVIAKAFAVIEKVEKRIEIRKKCERTFES